MDVQDAIARIIAAGLGDELEVILNTLLQDTEWVELVELARRPNDHRDESAR